MSKSKYTPRTLAALREKGLMPWMVERWIPGGHGHHGKRIDLFHIIDILAIDETRTVGVQSCGADFAAHIKTICDEPLTLQWLSCPHRTLEVWAWRKVKHETRNQKVLRPRIQSITVELVALYQQCGGDWQIFKRFVEA